ncbi:MAG TPA: alpha/beta fold hydrolase [Caulobacteraceae bacterium]|jgi:surfactin synthase thioesterase subunit
MDGDPARRWLPWSSDQMQAQSLRLLCLPHSGGSASTFRPWIKRYAAAGVTVCPVEYPGRGSRATEPLPSSVEEIAVAMRRDLGDWLRAAPYAVLGHSLGALVGYSLAERIELAGERAPERLVLCAARAPSGGRASPWHLLSRAALIDRLRTLGGMAERVLDNDEVLDIILPVIRADLATAEAWQSGRGYAPLKAPLIVVAGSADPMAPADSALAWRAYARGDFAAEVLTGDHFFLHAHADRIVALATGRALAKLPQDA